MKWDTNVCQTYFRNYQTRFKYFVTWSNSKNQNTKFWEKVVLHFKRKCRFEEASRSKKFGSSFVFKQLIIPNKQSNNNDYFRLVVPSDIVFLLRSLFFWWFGPRWWTGWPPRNLRRPRRRQDRKTLKIK